jgi:hypothetical protein
VKASKINNHKIYYGLKIFILSSIYKDEINIAGYPYNPFASRFG